MRKTPFLRFIAALLGVVQISVASAAPADAVDQAAFVQRVLELTNTERAAAGVPPLVLNSQLNDAAQRYSEVLGTSGCFAHDCGPTPDFGVRITQAGYSGWSSIAENIAAGYPSPEAVVAGWMGSPGHRKNILTPGFTELGVGVVNNATKFGTYWTQDFGARSRALVQPAPLQPVESVTSAPPQSAEMVTPAPPVQDDSAPPDDVGVPDDSDE